MLTHTSDRKNGIMGRVMPIISIIVPYSTGWCKSEKFKKIETVQWEMLLLILKNNYFCECSTNISINIDESHNKASNCICITMYIRSCYHPLSQFSYHMWLTTPERCWHRRCSVYIIYGAKGVADNTYQWWDTSSGCCQRWYSKAGI